MLRYFAVLLLTTFFASSAHASGEVTDGKHVNDYSFQCGAVFRVLQALYEGNGDDEKARLYKIKFDKRLAEAKAEYNRRGKTDADATAYMRKHLDTLVSLSERDAKAVVVFGRSCDKRFHE